ncbi:hypothetical protein OROGR_015898 [Orobanche gracilis]
MAGTSEPHASVFSAAEMEFLAEDEMIEIVPNLRMDPLNFISGDFGPFRPQIATEVPLWLAVALKRRGKCTVRAPDWMAVGCGGMSKYKAAVFSLQFSKYPKQIHVQICYCDFYFPLDKLAQVLEAERDSEKFQPLPFHYVEISRLLFDHAREDIPDVYMVRSLIEDIKDVRFHKIGTGLEIISKERTYALRLKNLSAMEANIVRPFITKALGTFYKLNSSEMIQESANVPNRQPQATNRGPRRQLKDR